jgi:hypothetical protein
MSPVKETNYFAYGVDAQGQLLYGDPALHHFPVTSFSDYQQLFAGAGAARAVGEASPIYLECPQAAGRIREMLPGVQLICSLRHPVDRAYSDYQMYVRSQGVRVDPARDLTSRAAWTKPGSHWMQIGSYHEQLRRYFDAFPREQIHVFLFDDLKDDALKVVQDVYRFVGVDSQFRPDFDAPHNVGGMPESRLLERVFTSSALKSAIAPWIPKATMNWIRRLRTRNMRPAPSLPRELRSELTSRFAEDIRRTGELVGRNLDHWL